MATEKEQIEELKKWWKESGTSVVTGVLIGLSLLLASKAWFGYQATQVLNASNVYAQMMTALEKDQREPVFVQANELIVNYSGTGYAPLAALTLAKIAVQDNELPAAQKQLQWALEHTELAPLKHTVRLRLIRVLLAQQFYSDAAALLKNVAEAGNYSYLYEELRGDMAMSQGDQVQAAAAYSKALNSMPPGSPGSAFLTAKYENISEAVATK